MLAYIALILVVLFVILDRSGLLADLGAALRKGGGGRLGQHPELGEKVKTDPETERRLEVFEEFIEGLETPEDDEE